MADDHEDPRVTLWRELQPRRERVDNREARLFNESAAANCERVDEREEDDLREVQAFVNELVHDLAVGDSKLVWATAPAGGWAFGVERKDGSLVTVTALVSTPE